MIGERVEYQDKRYKVLSFFDALEEYGERKKKGEKPVVIHMAEGYIVSEAVFVGEEPEGGKK